MLATGVTSTVLAEAAAEREAAEERVVRRRGVGEGVAMGKVDAETEAAEGGDVPIRPASSGH